MNIEESIDNVKFIIGDLKASNYNQTFIQAIETLLTAYEKEKEKNKRYEKYLKSKDKQHEQVLEYLETEKENEYISKEKNKRKNKRIL